MRRLPKFSSGTTKNSTALGEAQRHNSNVDKLSSRHMPNKVCVALITVLLLAPVGYSQVFGAVPGVTQPQVPSPLYGGTLTWGMVSEPPNLLDCNPTFIYTMVAQQLYNNLVDSDPVTLAWKPSLAQSWDSSPNGLTWTFHLVHNATWQDGVPFTSGDVKFSFEKVFPLCNSFAPPLMKTVSSIATPDNYTVVFNFNQTFAPLTSPVDAGIAGTGFGIVPAHLYQGTDILTNPYNQHPIGTGPWMYKEWVKGDHITFVRNPHYFKKGLPYLDQIIFRVFTSSSTLALALQQGSVDYVWGLSALSYPDAARLIALEKSGGLAGKHLWVWSGVSASIDYVMFNLGANGAAPLKNLNVRKAIVMAVNNSAINQLAYSNLATPLYTPVPNDPLVKWYFNPNATQPKYDPTAANQLLDQTGFQKSADGTRAINLNLVISTSYPTYPQEAAMIHDFLAQVGIKVNIVAVDFATFQTQVFVNNNYDMFIFPMSIGPDPALLYQYFTSYGITRTPWSNAGFWSDPQSDQLLRQSQSMADRTQRGNLVKQAEQIMIQNQPGMWTISRPYINFLNLDFSDQFQPGAWEWAEGGYMQHLEGIMWLKGSALTVTSAGSATSAAAATSATSTAAAPSGVDMTTVSAVLAALVIIIGVAYTTRKRKSATPAK